MPAKKKSPAISKSPLIPEMIAPLIHLLRQKKAILDSDLAQLRSFVDSTYPSSRDRNSAFSHAS
jgi:hypothetical protein